MTVCEHCLIGSAEIFCFAWFARDCVRAATRLSFWFSTRPCLRAYLLLLVCFPLLTICSLLSLLAVVSFDSLRKTALVDWFDSERGFAFKHLAYMYLAML